MSFVILANFGGLDSLTFLLTKMEEENKFSASLL